jgi:hypothetical protein
MQAQCPRYDTSPVTPRSKCLDAWVEAFLTPSPPLPSPPLPSPLPLPSFLLLAQFRVPPTAKPGGYCMVPIPPAPSAQPAYGGGGYGGAHMGGYGGGYGGGYQQNNGGGGMSNFAAGAAGGLGGYLLADALFDGGDCGGDFGGGDW